MGRTVVKDQSSAACCHQSARGIQKLLGPARLGKAVLFRASMPALSARDPSIVHLDLRGGRQGGRLPRLREQLARNKPGAAVRRCALPAKAARSALVISMGRALMTYSSRLAQIHPRSQQIHRQA